LFFKESPTQLQSSNPPNGKKINITKFNHIIKNTSTKKLSLFPAAEVVKEDEIIKQRRDLLQVSAPTLPSPMLSPSFSSDEDSVYSPSTVVNQDFQLDDLFNWDGIPTL